MIRFLLLSLISFMCLALPVHAQTRVVPGFEQVNQFSLDIFNKIETDNNMVLCPYSLASVLAFLINGSAEDTRDQLLQIFHLESNDDAGKIIQLLNSANHAMQPTPNICVGWLKCKFYALLNTLKSADQTQGYLISNSMWVDNSIAILPAFAQSLQQKVAINKIDFSNPVASMHAINQWVAKQTRYLITDLVPEETLSADIKLVLVNAIYFKQLWAKPFQVKDTVDQTFTLENHLSIQTSYMKQNNDFAYAESDTYQALALPYANSSFSMIILLPKKKHNVHEIMDNLTASTFTQLIDQLAIRKVSVSLPKFGITSSFLQLNDTLSSMGASDAFNAEKANFSLMSKTPLYISQIVQKAVIAVNESGTTAAAATMGGMGATAIVQPLAFNADHPFLFFIIDKQSRIILFTGQLMNP